MFHNSLSSLHNNNIYDNWNETKFGYGLEGSLFDDNDDKIDFIRRSSLLKF
jgi:hypothetical protein